MESEHYLQKPYETIWLFSFIFVNHVNAYRFGEVNVSVNVSVKVSAKMIECENVS